MLLDVIFPLLDNVKDYLLDDGTLVVSGRWNLAHGKRLRSEGIVVQYLGQQLSYCMVDMVENIREESPGCSQRDFNCTMEDEVQWSDDENTATLTLYLSFCTFIQYLRRTPRIRFIYCADDSPDPNIKYELVLRKWCELIPGAEFRCFVKENKIIGISQRDYTQYFDHISKQKEEIRKSIQYFFQEHIQYNFPDEDFVFDIYKDSQGKIWVIDFNPFGEVTGSLLFTWEELRRSWNLGDVENEEQDCPIFRYTNSEVTVQPSPYLSYRLLKDFVDLSTGEDAHKLIGFLKLNRNQQDEDSDD